MRNVYRILVVGLVGIMIWRWKDNIKMAIRIYIFLMWTALGCLRISDLVCSNTSHK